MSQLRDCRVHRVVRRSRRTGRTSVRPGRWPERQERHHLPARAGPRSAASPPPTPRSSGRLPEPYSVEAYDAATILLRGVDSGVTRPALLDFVKNYDGQGLARKYRWTDQGELTSNSIWIYKVQ